MIDSSMTSTTDKTIITSQRRFIQHLDDENFYRYLESHQGLSVIYFTSHGCASCRRWRELFREFLTVYDDVQVCAVDAQSNMALTQAYDVFHLPSLFLFIDGQYHRPLQPHASIASLREAIDQAVVLQPEDEP